jgi:hypothetical protein
MALAAPTNIAITRIRRVNRGDRLEYFCDLTWTNNEAGNHFVLVTLNIPPVPGSLVATSYTLPRGTNKLDALNMFNFSAAQSRNVADVVISVRVATATEESAPIELTRRLTLGEGGQVVGNLAYDGAGGINLPTWSGIAEVDAGNNWARVTFEALGVSQFGRLAAPGTSAFLDENGDWFMNINYGSILLNSGAVAYEERFASDGSGRTRLFGVGLLLDGNFYRATMAMRVARLPQVVNGSWTNSFEAVTQTTAFEYYRNGPAVPAFTSPLSVETFIDTPFSYTPTTAGASTFAANLGTNTNLTFGTANNTVSGTFDTPGNFSFSITATNALGSKTENIAVEVRPFTAQNASVRTARGVLSRTPLVASHPAIWSITGAGLAGFSLETDPPNFGTATGPNQTWLVGSHGNAGSFNIGLSASRAGVNPPQTSTAQAAVNIVDALGNTVVSGNTNILRDGLSVAVGAPVNIAFSSQPATANWQASGLPPGLSIDDQGRVTGAPTQEGTFFAAITAQAEGFNVSSAAGIRFVITPRVVSTVRGETAAQRSPWLLAQWELTDLQVRVRSREVQSTMFEEGKLRIKLGDAINFAVFFVNQNNAVFALDPSQLRLTIRRADNLDDLIIFKSGTPPEAAEQESQPYYLMPVTTGNREREVALEWAEDNGKNEPLPCVADLDWTKDGKVYSSRTFPVLLELDVTRP